MKKIIINSIITIFLIGIGYFIGFSQNTPSPQEPHKKIDRSKALQSWKDCDGCVRTQILDYLDNITDPELKAYVNPEDRIATFDMDGTFLMEKPFAMDVLILEYHIHKNMKDSTSLNNKLDTFLSRVDSVGYMTEDDYKTLDSLKMRAFDKLPEDSIAEIAYKFMLTDVKDSIRFRGHRYVDMFYKPMLELFSELQKNEFKVFVVSGADRTGLWGCIKALKEKHPEYNLQLDRLNLIGSDWVLDAVGNTNNDPSYIFQHRDQVARKGDTLVTSIMMQKVINIYRHIGKPPIFSGGNTDGDFSMLNMAMGDSSAKHKAILIWHDDDYREYKYSTSEDWAKKIEQYGWIKVSMKDNFKKIFLK